MREEGLKLRSNAAASLLGKEWAGLGERFSDGCISTDHDPIPLLLYCLCKSGPDQGNSGSQFNLNSRRKRALRSPF